MKRTKSTGCTQGINKIRKRQVILKITLICFRKNEIHKNNRNIVTIYLNTAIFFNRIYMCFIWKKNVEYVEV